MCASRGDDDDESVLVLGLACAWGKATRGCICVVCCERGQRYSQYLRPSGTSIPVWRALLALYSTN